MIAAIQRLNRTFDASAMERDLLAIADVVGNPAGYEGESHEGWTSVTVMSAPEGAGRLRPPGAAHLDRMPNTAKALDSLDCDIHLARLMTLVPGGVIREHNDPFIGFGCGLIRLHVPVTTHPDVELIVGGERCAWQPGELWYGDFSQAHSARNRSKLTRIHLVVDVHANERIVKLFPPTLEEQVRSALLRPRPAADLHAFEFQFELPAGFRVPGLAALRASRRGRLCAVGGALMAFLDGEPFLRLEPVSPQRLEVIGLPGAAFLECERRDGEIRHATLEFPGSGLSAIELRVCAP